MAITLEELRIRAKRRSDMENSCFIEDPEWNQYISDSYLELYDILVSKFEDYYTEDPLEFTLSGGSSTYDLPANFYKMVGLDKNIAGEDWYVVRPWSFEQRTRQRIAERIQGLYSATRYRIVADKLRFVPAEAADGRYRLWYVPRATELTQDTDTIDGVNGWEEYIVIDAAIKALTKEESDTRALTQQKMYQLQRIETMAQNRDAGETQRVSDVTVTGYDEPFFYRW